jgi:hypothetical protein
MKNGETKALLGFDVAEVLTGPIDAKADLFDARHGAKVGTETWAAAIDDGEEEEQVSNDAKGVGGT